MRRSRTRRSAAAVLVTGAAAVGLAGAAHAAGSTFDPSFGTAGRVTAPVEAYTSMYDQTVQRDGSVIGVGRADGGGNRDAVVFRLRPDGHLDTGFGVRHLDLGGDEQADAVVVQNDGKIVVAGRTSIGSDAVVWRLRADGSPDANFGVNGVRTIDSAALEGLSAVALAPDQKIVAAGFTTADGGQLAVYRLTTGGDLDPSFNGDGAFGFGGAGPDSAYAVAVQADRKVLVTGYNPEGSGAGIFRLTEGGYPDLGYGNAGRARLPVNSHVAYGFSRGPGGAVYVVTDTYSDQDDWNAVIFRVSAQGVVDQTFGGADGAVVDLGGNESLGRIATLPNGHVIAAGESSVGRDGLVAQFTAQGTPDLSLAPGGVLTLGGPLSYVNGLSVLADGRVVLGGDNGQTLYRPLFYRLLGSSTPLTCEGRLATIRGTNGSDVLVGTPGPDVIVALGGNDVVRGAGGNDVVCGGAGSDTLLGGAGADRLHGGTGPDLLRGQAGADRLYGEAGNDRLDGGTGRDLMVGGPGTDRASREVR